jgi:hypothetical protein
MPSREFRQGGGPSVNENVLRRHFHMLPYSKKVSEFYCNCICQALGMTPSSILMRQVNRKEKVHSYDWRLVLFGMVHWG